MRVGFPLTRENTQAYRVGCWGSCECVRQFIDSLTWTPEFWRTCTLVSAFLNFGTEFCFDLSTCCFRKEFVCP